MAHAVAGLGARAVALARRSVALSASHDDLLTPFDRAAAAACMATAFRSNGESLDALEWKRKTQALSAALDEHDRPVIQRMLGARGPGDE
jgi:hypothetical protein